MIDHDKNSQVKNRTKGLSTYNKNQNKEWKSVVP